MATDRALLKEAQTGALGSTAVTSASGAVANAHRRSFTWVKAAIDTNATDNTAEFNVVTLSRAARVVAAAFTPIANVASSATNTIQLTVSARLAADPANAVVVANSITNVSPLTAWTPYNITQVASAAEVTANSTLTFKVLKANSGVALAQGVLTIDIEEI